MAQNSPEPDIHAATSVVGVVPTERTQTPDRSDPLTATSRRPTVTAARPPRDSRERLLARLFAEVLDLETVGTEDDFFELGGDSLAVLALVARAREAGVPLSANDLFADRTVAGLARWQDPEAQVLLVNSKDAASASTASERQQHTLGDWVLASTSEGRWAIEPDRITAVLGYANGKIISAYDVAPPRSGESPYQVIDEAPGRPRVRFEGSPSRRLAHLIGAESPTRWGRGERNPVRLLPLAQLLPEPAPVESHSGQLQARLGEATITADEAGNLTVEVPPGVDVKIVRTVNRADLYRLIAVASAYFDLLHRTNPAAFDEDPDLRDLRQAVQLTRSDMAHGIGPQPDTTEVEALVRRAFQVIERHPLPSAS